MVCHYCQGEGHQEANCPERLQLQVQQDAVNEHHMRNKRMASLSYKLILKFRRMPFDWTVASYQEHDYDYEDGIRDDQGQIIWEDCTGCLKQVEMKWPLPLCHMVVVPEELGHKLLDGKDGTCLLDGYRQTGSRLCIAPTGLLEMFRETQLTRGNGIECLCSECQQRLVEYLNWRLWNYLTPVLPILCPPVVRILTNYLCQDMGLALIL